MTALAFDTDERDEDVPWYFTCTDHGGCGEEFYVGQVCECHEPADDDEMVG